VLSNDSDPDGDALTITNVGTPAHGTAYDIAGKGIASVGATRAALLLAAEMAVRRRRLAFTGGTDERIPGAAAERGRGQQ